MSMGYAARRITTLLLIAALVPTPGLSWPAPAARFGGAADLLADRVFLDALNSTEQQVMSGPGRPQLFLVFRVNLAVPPSGPSLLNAGASSWLKDFLSELQKQPATTGPATVAAPAGSIIDEIAASDAHVRSMTSAKQLASMPDSLPYEANPFDNVPASRTIGVALETALQRAGFDSDGERRTDRQTGAVIYEGQTADGAIVVTGQLVDGRIELTKEFRPLTGGGDVGDPVRIRATGTSTTTSTPSTTNTSTTTTTNTSTTDTSTTANTSATTSTPIRTITATPTLTAGMATAPMSTGVRLVTSDGTPGDSVYLSQPFRVEAGVPAAGAPPVLNATLTTADGQKQTIVLVRQATRDGLATYTSATISFHGGRIAPGTLQGLDVSNGQIVTATVQGAGQAGVAVYTDDIQVGIARVNEALTATSDELIRQRNFVDSQMKDPAVTSDAKQMENLKQWRADIDRKMTFIVETREAMAGTDLPGLQLMYGQRRFEWLTGNWDEFDPRVWYGNTVVYEQFKVRTGELFTDVMRGFTMGAYQQVARMSMIAQFRSVFTGYNEFNEKLTYEQLLAENKGLAFDLAMFWVPGKFTETLTQGKFTGELVISGGTPGGRILVPPRTPPMTAAGGSRTTGGTGTPTVTGAKPPVVSPTAGIPPNRPATGADQPAAPGGATTPRTTTAAGDKTQVFPEPVNRDGNIDGKPGAKTKPVSEADQIAHEVETAAELQQAFDEMVVRARAAGVTEPRIKDLTTQGAGHPDSINALYKETLRAEGKQVTMPLDEFGQASTFATRNTLGTLTDADYDWLRNKLAADPNYLDGLPNRGRMDGSDGFITPVNGEQLGDLMKNPRVAQLVDDAKTAAAANNTPTVVLPSGSTGATLAGAGDKTQIIPPPAGAGDKTQILPPPRSPADVEDLTKTQILSPQTQSPTVRMDPNRTALIDNADATPTVKLDPNTTEIMPPPSATPTVRMDPTSTALIPPSDPNATARMTNELMQSLPQAHQSGMSPQQMANSVRGMASKLGVQPQQLVNSLRQRLDPRPISMSGLGDSSTAPSRAGLDVSLEASGVSSGGAFTVRATNAGATPFELHGEGVVVEPVRAAPVRESGSQSLSKGRAGPEAALSVQAATQRVEAFCLERVRPVPVPGTEYRVAPPAAQAQHRRLVDVLHAAQRVMDAGGLRPDSEIQGYFNSIRQWSIWTRQENFDQQRFTDEFINQTKKSVEERGVKWTNQMRDTVRKVAPGRWRDILAVLGEAANFRASAGRGPVALLAAATRQSVSLIRHRRFEWIRR